MADISKYYLETERLILRPFEHGDLNDFYEYASVDGVGEKAGWKHHASIEESETILNRFLENKCDFAIIDKTSNKVIGSFGIMNSILKGYEQYSQVELGYVLAKPYWNKGLMTEACQRVIKFCFEDLRLEMVWIEHFDFNVASQRVIQKCGFNFVKETPIKIDCNNATSILKYNKFNPDLFSK